MVIPNIRAFHAQKPRSTTIAARTPPDKLRCVPDGSRRFIDARFAHRLIHVDNGTGLQNVCSSSEKSWHSSRSVLGGKRSGESSSREASSRHAQSSTIGQKAVASGLVAPCGDVHRFDDPFRRRHSNECSATVLQSEQADPPGFAAEHGDGGARRHDWRGLCLLEQGPGCSRYPEEARLECSRGVCCCRIPCRFGTSQLDPRHSVFYSTARPFYHTHTPNPTPKCLDPYPTPLLPCSKAVTPLDTDVLNMATVNRLKLSCQ